MIPKSKLKSHITMDFVPTTVDGIFRCRVIKLNGLTDTSTLTEIIQDEIHQTGWNNVTIFITYDDFIFLRVSLDDIKKFNHMENKNCKFYLRNSETVEDGSPKYDMSYTPSIGSVAVVLFDPEIKNILMITETFDNGEVDEKFPSVAMNFGETKTEAVYRCLEEKLNIDKKYVDEMKIIGRWQRGPCGVKDDFLVFSCCLNSIPDEISVEEFEFSSRWISVDDLLRDDNEKAYKKLKIIERWIQLQIKDESVVDFSCCMNSIPDEINIKEFVNAGYSWFPLEDLMGDDTENAKKLFVNWVRSNYDFMNNVDNQMDFNNSDEINIWTW